MYPRPSGCSAGRRCRPATPPAHHAPSRSGEPVAHCRAFRRGGGARGGEHRPGWWPSCQPRRPSRPWHTHGPTLRGAAPFCRAFAARHPVASVASAALVASPPACPPPPPISFPLTRSRRPRLYHPTAVGVVAEAPPPVVARRQPVSGRPARRGDLLPSVAVVRRPAPGGGGVAVPHRRWSSYGLLGAAVRGPWWLGGGLGAGRAGRGPRRQRRVRCGQQPNHHAPRAGRVDR